MTEHANGSRPAASRALLHSRAGEILADCLEKPISKRSSFVSTATAGEPELEALVRELLRASERSGTFLDGAVPGEQAREMAAALLGSTPAGGASDREADRVAGYELVEPLGSGGFGTVWLARQLHPVRREVALKVLKLGMDTREIVARFEQERQSLARMSHENVARVLDAGVTESGRPFFAMELVRGRPITQHCDAERLDVRARLRLFVEACRGVQHAHQRGIIHRDLKPSNVLVTTEGGRAIPKVIDFGIAKAIVGEPEDMLVRTRHDEVLGTPAYMSPEQATPGAAADTRTDVYSLGVLLYELLTGMLPFERSALSRVSSGTRGRDEAQRPSDRLATHGSLGDVARARSTEPRALRREITGDLDWIVMTAMWSEPDRRYPSVDALVADVERHLEHLPVEARPPSAIYRLGKFTRKHRFGVAAASAGIVLLVAGLLGTSYGLAAAMRARAVAEERTARAEEQAYSGSMLLAEQAIRSRRLEAARALLDQAPERLRGWEWSHLSGRLDTDVHRLGPRGRSIDAMVVTADGSRCWAWNRTTLDAWLPGGHGPATSVAIENWNEGGWFAETADGSILAARGLGGRILRIEGSSRVVDLPPLPGEIFGFCFDPTMERIFWRDASDVLYSRPASGGPVSRGPQLWSQREGNTLVTRDGARLIAAGRHFVTVIDAATLKILESTRWPATRELAAVAMSPDETLLALGYSDGTVELRALKPSFFDLRATLASDPSWVTDLAFSADGARLAAGFGGGSVRTWDVESAVLEDSLALSGAPAGVIAFLGDRLLFAPWEEGLMSWKPGADEHRRMRGHAAYVYSVALLHGGSLAVSGGWDARAGKSGGLKWWDVPSRRLVAAWGDDAANVRSVATSRDGRRVLVAHDLSRPDSAVTVFDSETGAVLRSFVARGRTMCAVAEIDAQSLIALTTSDAEGEAFLLDLSSGATSRLAGTGLTSGRSDTSRALAVSRDGRWLALSSGVGGIDLFDARTRTRIARRTAHDAATWSVSFSPGGESLATTSDDGTIGVWSVPSLELVSRLRGSGNPVMCAEWSPDASRLAAGTRDGGIELWDPARALLVARLTGHASYVKSVAWTPDGHALLSASGDHDVRVWDLKSADDVAASGAERDALLARLDADVSSRLQASDPRDVAQWIDEAAGPSARERQVARQALLRHGLEATR